MVITDRLNINSLIKIRMNISKITQHNLDPIKDFIHRNDFFTARDSL